MDLKTQNLGTISSPPKAQLQRAPVIGLRGAPSRSFFRPSSKAISPGASALRSAGAQWAQAVQAVGFELFNKEKSVFSCQKIPWDDIMGVCTERDSPEQRDRLPTLGDG